MTDNRGASTSGERRGRLPLRLRIAGADLLLNGRFDHWQAMLTSGADLDQAAVRLVVDATSSGTPRGQDQRQDLFSFEGRKVRQVGAGSYEVQGVIATGDRKGTRLDVLVEAPAIHTAFFSLSFVARKEQLGDDAWHGLTGSWTDDVPSSSAAEGEEGQQMNAKGWPRAPVLAAA